MGGAERWRWKVVLVPALSGWAAFSGCRGAGVSGMSPDAAVGVLDASIELAPERPLSLPDGPPPPPPGPENCGNGLDDDDNGAIDDGCFCAPGAEQPCFPGRAPLAGIGLCAAGAQVCLGSSEIGHWGACAGAIVPSGEICDGLDNDCNGRADDGCECELAATRACYRGPAGTADVGVCRSGTESCAPGSGGLGSRWAGCTNDVLPSAEVCDGVDNDCNGTVDDGCACRPGESRACYGGPPATAGVGPCLAGTQRCVAVGPSAQWGACENQVLPAPELCDRADNDCDGLADDGCNCTVGASRACYDGPPPTRGVGSCADGSQTCLAGPAGVGSNWGACAGARLPTAELCNEIDDDCDGTIDDGCACRRGQTRGCYDGPAGTAGVGICRAGSQSCIVEAGTARFGPCAGQILPAAAGETCNGLDDDCDGRTDGLTRFCGSNVGDCRPGTETCTTGSWSSCAGAVGPAPEDCNGGDEDCDGMVDEGCECLDGSTTACGPPEGNVGACRMGTRTCVGGRYAGCVGSVGPMSEICNGADDDCDGIIDDGCECIVGTSRPCYGGPPNTAGVGPCKAGTQTCAATAGVAGWGACSGEVRPRPEMCNGGDDDCNGAADDGFSTPEQIVVPRAPNRKADILFVIDNSLSMDPHQENLLANFPVLMSTLRGFPGGLPDLHLAVITSDLGAGPETGISGCTPGGHGGAFRVPAANATCQGPTGTFIEASNNEAMKNYPGTIEEAFTCIADVGTAGCGFEHSLASAAMALGFFGAVPAANTGFLRPDAFLALAFITNEDDCSAPFDTALFNTGSLTLSDPLGPVGNFRCQEYGHLCGGARPPRVGSTPVTLSQCRSAEDGVLFRVEEIADFFRSLKNDPSMLFVSAIAGPPTPYVVNYAPGVGTTDLWPSVGRSCLRGTAYADPAVRMAELVTGFGENGSFSSICADSYAPALERLGNAIGRGLTPHCLDAAVPDRDASRPGIQASCLVISRVPGDGGTVETSLSQCDVAGPSGGPQPCWYLASNATCTSGIQFTVNRSGGPPAGETIAVRCNACGGGTP